ncbi:MAG: type II toxin-antitoxin system VapC family toxin [Chloroflexota bacterium]
MRLLDANIFLRALVRADTAREKGKAAACASLFERLAAGEEEATTLEAIIASVCYVLRSPRQYGLPPTEIAKRLGPLLQVRGLKLPFKRTYLRALDLWAAWPKLDFDDVLLVAHAERLGSAELLSYDHDFDSIPGLVRAEPEL